MFDVGHRLTPSHANKKGTRYRYYVSQRLIAPKRATGDANDAHANRMRGGRRVPASDLEAAVESRITAFLRDRPDLYDKLRQRYPTSPPRSAIVERASQTANEWPALDAPAKRVLCQRLIERITLLPNAITIAVKHAGIMSLASPGSESVLIPQSALDAPDVSPELADILLTAPAIKKRTGVEARLIFGAAAARRREQDRSLLRMLAQAQSFREKVLSVPEERSAAEIATKAGFTMTYFTRVLKLSFLAPEIVDAILGERHPSAWIAKRLSLDIRLPLAWSEQKKMLGFM